MQLFADISLLIFIMNDTVKIPKKRGAVKNQQRRNYMAVRKPVTVEDYFKKNSARFIKFGETFASMLNNKELINSLAEKDLEKLAKVWKLVFEMLDENSAGSSEDKLSELIGAFSKLGKDDEE